MLSKEGWRSMRPDPQTTKLKRSKPPFIIAECDGCRDDIKEKKDEKACPKCSGYFHKGECYYTHYEQQHRY